MDAITEPQLQSVLQASAKLGPQMRHYTHHHCGGCNSPVGYVVQDGLIGYDSNCDCSRFGSPIQVREPSDLLDHFNQQTPETRAAFWSSFKAALGVTDEMIAAQMVKHNDAKVIARAREVANLSQHSMASGYGPSDVGDVLARWLTGEMPLAEVMESFDGLALDYQRKPEKVNA